MEGLSIIKTTELTALIQLVTDLKETVKQLEEKEYLKAYSIQEIADNLGVDYGTVRKWIIQKKLHAIYVNGNKGRCVIPAWSVKAYLEEYKPKSKFK